MSQAGTFNAGAPPPGTVVESLTGNVGGPVGPDGAGNIDVLGVNLLTVIGTPVLNLLEIELVDGAAGQLIIGGGGAGAIWADLTSTGGTIDITPGVNTLNIETAGTVATTYTTDAGNAIPALGVLNVLGGTNMNTAGAGNTVTINLDDDVTLLGFLSAGTTVTAGTGLIATTGGVNATGNSILNGGTVDIGTDVAVNTISIGTAGARDVIVGSTTAGATTTVQGPLGGVFALGVATNAVANTEMVTIDTVTGELGSDTIPTGFATTFTTDSGNAVPAAGVLNVLGGTNASTSGAGNTITIDVTGAGGFTWTVITTAQTGTDNNGYFTNDAGPVDVALPAVSVVGDTFQVAAMSAGGWTISQAAGQQIRVGNSTTTLGITGSLASTAQGDWITLVCSVADTSWMAFVNQGNPNVI